MSDGNEADPYRIAAEFLMLSFVKRYDYPPFGPNSDYAIDFIDVVSEGLRNTTLAARSGKLDAL